MVAGRRPAPVFRQSPGPIGDRSTHEGVALVQGQFVLHYQPKISLETWSVCGVEALVRWQHPTRGLLEPAEFLHLLDEVGLTAELTHIVFQLALDQAVTWWRAGSLLSVAVNVSAGMAADDRLPDYVLALLAERKLPPAALQVEITEDFLRADRTRAGAVLSRLREHGVRIAVDDFGTGYRSLSHLRDWPIDLLKLDVPSVADVGRDPHAAALVASTIQMAHSLGLQLVAEGVGDAPSLLALTRLGCDQAQGYYLGRPMPSADLMAWLRMHRTNEAMPDPMPQATGHTA